MMCDYDHEADEIRRLPMGEPEDHSGIWVCRAHFEEEITGSYIIDQIWRTLPLQEDGFVEPPSDTQVGPYNDQGELI